MDSKIQQALTLLAQALEDLEVDIDQNNRFVEFKPTKGKNYGKGIIWSGVGATKQLVLQSSPDKVWCSEISILAGAKAIILITNRY